MRKAVGYIRVSTLKQAEHGVSLEAQRAKIEAYCTLHDLDLVALLQDESSAKSIDDRPAMKRLLAMARGGEVEVVVTPKLDRMFRNVDETRQVIRELQDLGVDAHIMNMNGISIDTSSANGLLFLTMLAAFAEFERMQISDRTRTALAHKRETGKQHSAIAPYGWSYVEGETLRNEQEQFAVGLMFGYRKDGMTLKAIAGELDKQKIKPRSSRIWQPSVIGKILKHPLNIDIHAAHSSELHETATTGNGGKVSPEAHRVQ